MTSRLEINVTRCCNKDCDFCYIKKRGLYLPYETFVRLIERHAPTQLILTGGEALLHPDVFAFIEYASTKNITTILFTNGLLLTDETLERLRPYHVSLQVSYPLPSSVLLRQLLRAKDLDFQILTSTIYLKRTIPHVSRILTDVLPFESNAFLFPTPINKLTVADVIAAPDWYDMLALLNREASRIGNNLYVERAYLPEQKKIPPMYRCAIGDDNVIFIDADGQERPCCLMSDIEPDPTIIPNQGACAHCRGGCPALRTLYGHDPRCQKGWIPVCPLILVNPKEDRYAYEDPITHE